MRNRISYLAFALIACMITIAAAAQTATTISGSVKNPKTQEAIPAVSITVKGTNIGTYTDEKGAFRLTLSQKLPVTLVVSSVGFGSKEIVVTTNNEVLNVTMDATYALGEDIVVAASRTPERILESPVTIERVNASAIRNAPAASYYDVLANVKGVDMTTSSLLFKTPSTRGFNGSGNLRFNQLVDGMDNQAPGLNFSVGNIIGLTELDVDNMELLSGASSALYGPGGMNGTLLINSKNPFKYQGLSFQIKHGTMHVDDHQRSASPYYDWSVRWGKKVSEKFAFKIGAQLVQAQDWQANDQRNLLRNNVLSTVKAGDRTSDPNYDGVNVFGDEVSTAIALVAQSAQAQYNGGILLATGGAFNAVNSLNAALNAGLTPAQFLGSLPPSLQPLIPTIQQMLPFYLGLRNNLYGSQYVSRTGYQEKDMVDYNTYNFKFSGGLYYKLGHNVDASFTANWGMGTAVYTGADRYSLRNFKMGQYKLEFKGANWSVKGYTTQENSGDSYASTIAAILVNRAWRDDATWFGTYTGNYAGARLQGASDAAAHAVARAAADAPRYAPGSAAFKNALDVVTSKPIGKGGAKFADATDLYHLEGQYNLSSAVNNVVNLIAGANFRSYSLNSQGTIFVDTTGKINYNEYGAYLQAQKGFANDVLKLTGSLRYDKNENFKGRVTPRITAVIQVAKDNNIRLSYQTAYRFPTAQDMYINLQTPGSRLIGGLPQFNTYFNFAGAPVYTAASIADYRASFLAGAPNPTLLKQGKFTTVNPETVASYELGFKGLVTKKLLIDVYGYYSKYKDFIAREAVGRGVSRDDTKKNTELISASTTEAYSFVTNTSTRVKAMGWGASAQYQVGKGFNIMANVYSDELRDLPAGFVAFFNTPKYRYNLGVGNENVYKGFGFNIIYKWQDKINWEGTFAAGEVPAYGTLDGQISYKLPKIKSMLKLGATNMMNHYNRSAFGNPQVGALGYLSFAYNIL
jgi:outer membrane receptor protein involved in Fe transport